MDQEITLAEARNQFYIEHNLDPKCPEPPLWYQIICSIYKLFYRK